MLVGTADVDALAAGAATIDSFDTEAVVFDDVLVLHALFELPYAVREALLPPALHPTNPPIAAVLAWRVERSEWGRFSMVQVNIGCHTFRATGITAYLEAGGTLENAQAMAAHESPRTTKLYDRTSDEITLDEVERIAI